MVEAKSRYDISHLIGQKFNRLTIKEDIGIHKHGRKVSAACECGKEGIYYVSFLKTGHTKSCGCLNKEKQAENKIKMTKHGKTGDDIYMLWKSIRARCYNKNDPRYANYGGRGVTMCEEWKASFQPFYDWCISNGWKKGLAIDKDKLYPGKNGMIYSPEYCCFLTPRENCQHREITLNIEYNGRVDSLSNFCRELSLNYHLVYSRVRRGVSVKDAIEKPATLGGARYKGQKTINTIN